MNSEYEQRGDSEYEKRGCSHYYKLLWVMFQSVKCTCSSCDHVTMLTVCSCDHVLEFLLRTPSMMRQESPFTKIIIWLIPMLYLYGSIFSTLTAQSNISRYGGMYTWRTNNVHHHLRKISLEQEAGMSLLSTICSCYLYSLLSWM